VLYLLQRGAKLDEEDNEGKSIFHICAYTGHVEALKVVRNAMKIKQIRALN
jgi:ankyrin repeat protein